MRCATARKNITAYTDGELHGRELDRMKAHLGGCPECRQAAAELRATAGVLSGMAELEPSPGFDAAFRARLDAERVGRAAREQEGRDREERRRPWLGLLHAPALRPALGTAAVAILVAGLLYYRVGPGREAGPEDLEASLQEIQMALEVDMLRDMEMLRNLELLEDFDTIEQLDRYSG